MLLFVSFTGVFLLSGIIYLVSRKEKPKNSIMTGDHAQQILKSLDYNRSKPNQWLINTLFIVNPFTIASQSLLTEFKGEVLNTLKLWTNEKKYDELVLTIRHRIQYRLRLLQSNNSQVCLSELVKQVTLDSFLSGILNVNATEDLLTELPDLIIHLWKHRTDKQAQDRLKELLLVNKDCFSKSEFWHKIQMVLSNHSTIISQTVTNDFDEKISNPLNIIVPGWETMWRVVFYSLLELLRHPQLLQQLRQELNNSSLSSYRKCHLLQSILKETLRLYPPTKNIYRTNIKTNQDVRINIQYIHRDTNVWGPDALDFRPDRFKEKSTNEQEKSYLPFSISCPARHGFAYGFAGAIVAEILHHCPRFTIAEGFSSLPTDKPLDMTRNSYNDLLIIT